MRVDELVDVVEVQKVVHEEQLVHGVVEEKVRWFLDDNSKNTFTNDKYISAYWDSPNLVAFASF